MIDGWIDLWMDLLMDRWINGWIDLLIMKGIESDRTTYELPIVRSIDRSIDPSIHPFIGRGTKRETDTSVKRSHVTNTKAVKKKKSRAPPNPSHLLVQRNGL